MSVTQRILDLCLTCLFFPKYWRGLYRELQAYLDGNTLMPVRQLAYRLYHSTETAVTKVFDKLLQAADEGDVSAFCLDLTAAFDTVDHDLMLLKLDGHGLAIKLGSDTIEPSGHVCILGVIMSFDLCLEKYASAVRATCFFHLRQICRVWQSLDVDVGSANTLVQAFVTSRVDYCNAVLAESPRVITDKLQRVMNSAARVITNTRKYDSGLSRLMHDELHWLDVTDQV